MAEYLDHDRSFAYADAEKRDILSLYAADIMKIDARYRSKVRAVFKQIPGFLSRHEKRVVLSDVGSASFERYHDAFFWLADSMIANAVMQELTSSGYRPYFYTRYNTEKHRNDIEIDFLISNRSKTNCRIFPIEVKSTDRYSVKSLERFLDVFGRRVGQAYVIHTKNLRTTERIKYLP
ncbi:MAG: DUF4143 domain-containing protein, partial [Clostridiales bacterium]|nr:DUF4143 domain-containing protein [Clostridiales bacterium]